MPELPEVETIRRQLDPLLSAREIVDVEILDQRWTAPVPARDIAEALKGRRILGLGRRGKYLLWQLSGQAWLVQHLRMTGIVLFDPPSDPPHARVRITLDASKAGQRARVVICDPRRFGTAVLLHGADALNAHLSERLGVEPFDPEFTPALLHSALKLRRAPVKAVLLDQRVIAGIGNIYADEALFAAKIHPARSAQTLAKQQSARLHAAILAALSAGIDARGASIDDFRHVDGVRGSFQDRFAVHLRAGEPCLQCGTLISKIRVASRGTYFCPSCQRMPAGGRSQAASSSAKRPL